MPFDHIQNYALQKQAFPGTSKNDALFLAAMQKNYSFQYARQPYVRALAQRYGFSPEDLKTPEDVYRVPPLFVETMKYHCFLSIPKEQVTMNLTSSGTGGQKTQAFFDAQGVARIQTISAQIFKDVGFCSDEPAGYLMFSYAREDAREIGTSWSDEQEMQCAPVRESRWLLRKKTNGQFDFDPREAARSLYEMAQKGPIRMLGFPAFMFQTLEEMERMHLQVRVHPQSFVIAGGGWKNHAGTPMSQKEFAAELEQRLGLPRTNVRDLYGMVEHGIAYCSCPEGHHHVPAFARVAVRHPVTLERQPYGNEGLLHLLAPWNVAQPNCSVLSTDLVKIETGCSCGIPGEYIASIRRGGNKKHKGCALSAQEILDRIRSAREAK
ncbi:LuxE/PaaK family acyltransferase [Desulfoplanes sp. PS50]|jgi:phenylacetate-coenzyme A ligase PaaK-like adenylate-forming protein